MATKNIKVVEKPGDGPYMDAYIDGLPESGGSDYELPAATKTTLGGVKQAAHVASATGDNVTAAEFETLLDALEAAGIIASS